jgi:glycosyltransferase involved in cell wall biosynthesis
MKILFLTLGTISTLNDRGIYTDLLRKFKEAGDEVYLVNPIERREKKATYLIDEDGVKILRVKTLNIQKINVIEKGIATLSIEYLFLNAIKKNFSDVKFDLVLYSTPPITFTKVIKYIKNRDNAYCYLLLKDIFPQNAVDMKMLKQGGLLHRFFLSKEKKLYNISDYIGCLSEANCEFIFRHNKYLPQSKVEVNPNSIEPLVILRNKEKRDAILTKYKLPLDKKIFVYGGNLGKPQGLDFLLETIQKTTHPNVYFLVVGSGTEYIRVEKWFKDHNPKNAVLFAGLPKQDYDVLLNACDVGLIFLHKDFTIPNFPSRLLSYLEMKIPVIAATDPNTDIGDIIEEYNCGYKVISGDSQKMQEVINDLCSDEEKMKQLGENGWKLLEKKYNVSISYNLIKNKILNV